MLIAAIVTAAVLGFFAGWALTARALYIAWGRQEPTVAMWCALALPIVWAWLIVTWEPKRHLSAAERIDVELAMLDKGR